MPFDRGWQATIDGINARLFRADYGLTALLLPAGRHQVELHYFVRGRSLGKWLSLAALLVLLVVAGKQVAVRNKRRARGTTSQSSSGT